MSHELIHPPYKKDSYGKQCHEMFDDSHEWTPWISDNPNNARNWLQRRGTVSERDHQYWISEIGVDLGGDTPDRTIIHALFCVAAMSMDVGTHSREMRSWYISEAPFEDKEAIVYIQSTMPGSYGDSEGYSAAFSGMRFALENGLTAPNDDDISELTIAIGALRRNYIQPQNW